MTGVSAGISVITYTNIGGCTATATVYVNSGAAATPGAFTASTTTITVYNSPYTYTVPLVAGVTYNWSFSGTGATITGKGNSVTVTYSATATLGALSVTANNGCGTSAAQSLAIGGLKALRIPINTLQGSVDTTAIFNVAVIQSELKAYPNPTSGSVTFEFRVNANARVKIDIFSISGLHISRIFDSDIEAGIRHTVFFDQTLPSGIYPCVMSWNGKMITVKLVVIQ